MGHFYFHVKDGGDLIQDEEGIELPSVEAAKRLALQTARELLCQAVKAGKATVPEAVVIADDAGRQLDILPLAAVLPEPLKR